MRTHSLIAPLCLCSRAGCDFPGRRHSRRSGRRPHSRSYGHPDERSDKYLAQGVDQRCWPVRVPSGAVRAAAEQDRFIRDARGRVVLFNPSLIGTDGRASTSVFSNPGLLQAGTLGLSAVSGPWFSTFDMGVRKSFRFRLTEEARIQLRFDVFNLFNRANFNVTSQPASGALDGLGVFNRHNINSTSFGLIDDTFSQREMQVGLKILF